MPSCLPPRYRLLDLVFAVGGTLAFLGDLGVDVWSAVKYYQRGDFVLCGLHIGLYVFSSSVLQLLSWGWFWVDRREWVPEIVAASARSVANGHTELNGKEGAEKPQLEDGGGESLPLQDSHTSVPAPAMTDTEPGTAEHEEYASFITHFYTSHIWLRPCCLSILHLLQLGYPFRCLHSLEVGLAAYKSSESSPKFNLYQEYAYFLTHDISMMRLVETFLENTPQLILVLYNIIQRETIYLFQCFSIAISFICISWAILDYHQSLRLFLKDKQKLNILSSVVYFLWNFCLISSRILCITLFALTFHWLIALHFVSVWLVFFLWAFLQKTELMKNKFLEPFYRATVAVILYFSWFNIADGRTIYRCIVYHMFITIDSMLLLLSWKFLKFPSILDKYETSIIITTILLIGVGLVIRLIYYKCVHPNVTRGTNVCHDEPDAKVDVTYRMVAPTVEKRAWKQNHRLAHLAQQIY